jgi:hypothetical protein
MYRKASEQASFARRRGNRQPGSSLVLSETRKALAWLGMAWLPRVTVVLVGLAKGREGGDPGHDALLLVCCVCIIFFHLLSKLWTCHSRDPTIGTCLSTDPTILPWKKNIPFPEVWKNSLLSPPPYPRPPPPRLPQKISKNQLSPGFAGWMPRLLPFRKKYGAWIEPTPVKNWNISFYGTFYRQLTNNSAKFSFICCILVWFLGVWIFHPKVVSNWMRSKPYSFFSWMGYDNFRVSSFFWYTESLLASVLTGCNGPFARALPH